MLFVLTGDVQIGKTRWLTGLIDELRRLGVVSEGVLAPGVWQRRHESAVAAEASADAGDVGDSCDVGDLASPIGSSGLGDSGGSIGSGGPLDSSVSAASGGPGSPGGSIESGGPSGSTALDGEDLSAKPGLGGAGAYEKLGIDNVLLPSGLTIPFARRRDLAQREGTYVASSQSARIGMGWEVSDEAISQVNAHFEKLARRSAGVRGASSSASASTFASAPALTATSSSAPAPTPSAAQAPNVSSARLLVVDELGRLELEHGLGLTAALRLLDAGPTERFPHALIVVRDWLLPAARERFEPAWGTLCAIGPDEAGRADVLRAFGITG